MFRDLVNQALANQKAETIKSDVTPNFSVNLPDTSKDVIDAIQKGLGSTSPVKNQKAKELLDLQVKKHAKNKKRKNVKKKMKVVNKKEVMIPSKKTLVIGGVSLVLLVLIIFAVFK